MAKYRPLLAVRPTRWRLGAPTTSIPAWAHPKNKNKNLNINDDSSNESIEADPVISGTPGATDISVTENETIMKMITEISNHDTSQNRSGNAFMTTDQIINTSEVASQTFSDKGVMTTTQIPNTSEVASQTVSDKGVMTTTQIPNTSEIVKSVNNTR
ncbi:unnamed protein product [Parnassius apollo]|uniref:(apollo) hypothetical protein n=1 Tax=Parnassius apollo TaxID=110799 RepID=A0A8S3XLZ0_PARAO|nr:unnamed protein product [Parnassius apollo]